MAWLGTWAKRRELTIDYSKVKAALTDFPTLLRLSTASGQTSKDLTSIFTLLGANSKKIALTTDDGLTECKIEIPRWNNAENQGWLWAKVPSISAAADTKLYLYYDAAAADNDTNVGVIGSAPAIAVWSNGFVCVMHFTEQGNATANEYKDSTGRGNHGTAHGVAAGYHPHREVNSKFGYHQDFAGYGTYEKIVIPHSADLSQLTTGYLSFSLWLNHDTVTPPYYSTIVDYNHIFTKAETNDQQEYLLRQYAYGETPPTNGTAPGMTTFYVLGENMEYGTGAALYGASGVNWTKTAVRQAAGEWFLAQFTLDSTNLTQGRANLRALYNGWNGNIAENEAVASSSPESIWDTYGTQRRAVTYNTAGGGGQYDVFEHLMVSTSPLVLGGGRLTNETLEPGPHLVWNGKQAELHISNVKRSLSWMLANYHNQDDSLITYGDEESYSGGGFTLPPNAISVNKSKLPLLMGM